MLVSKNQFASQKSPGRRSIVVLLIALLAFEVIIGLLLAGESWTVDWLALILITANIAVWGIPVFLEIKGKQFDFFHPLVFAAFVFALPMIVIKGSYLAFGGRSSLLALTNDPDHYVHLALGWMAIGWSAVLLGFYLPRGGLIVKGIRLPKWLRTEHKLRLLPVLVAFIIGVIFNLLMIREGAFGSSLSEISGDLSLVSVLRPLSGIMSMAFFLLVFGTTRYIGAKGWRLSAIFAGITVIGFMLVSGSRSALFSTMIIVTMAIFYGRYARIVARKLIPFLAISVLALFAGVLVISQFRNIRVSTYGDLPVSMEETISLMGGALQNTGQLLFNEQVGLIGTSLVERFVGIDTFGVTLARAESLQSAEKEAGINNNILNELIVGFVPRAIWPNKPLVGEFGLAFTRIYLESPYRSSNGPTMFGDLYRNFGYFGIPIGMFIVGLYLRLLYGSLIQRGVRSTFAPLFYVFLYGVFNWEATYTPFILDGFRTLITLMAITALIYVLGGTRPDARRTSSVANR